MTFAGKALLFWLAYAVMFSVVFGIVVRFTTPRLQPSKQVDLYLELLQ